MLNTEKVPGNTLQQNACKSAVKFIYNICLQSNKCLALAYIDTSKPMLCRNLARKISLLSTSKLHLAGWFPHNFAIKLFNTLRQLQSVQLHSYDKTFRSPEASAKKFDITRGERHVLGPPEDLKGVVLQSTRLKFRKPGSSLQGVSFILLLASVHAISIVGKPCIDVALPWPGWMFILLAGFNCI